VYREVYKKKKYPQQKKQKSLKIYEPFSDEKQKTKKKSLMTHKRKVNKTKIIYLYYIVCVYDEK
jgi:hypothetical protein